MIGQPTRPSPSHLLPSAQIGCPRRQAPLPVIGGLVSATLLTLMLLPTLYLMVEQKNEAVGANPSPAPSSP